MPPSGLPARVPSVRFYHTTHFRESAYSGPPERIFTPIETIGCRRATRQRVLPTPQEARFVMLDSAHDFD
jgi:hypothetical protein